MNRMMSAALVALLGVASAGQAAVAAPFSERTIRGTWTLFVQGFVSAPEGLGPFPAGTPLVAIATVTFDGRGGCRSIDQLVVGGVRIPADPEEFRDTGEDGCTYVVNPDGTGFFQVTFPAQQVDDGAEIPESTTTASFVIQNRSRMHFIADNTEIGIFGGGEMQRQQRPAR